MSIAFKKKILYYIKLRKLGYSIYEIIRLLPIDKKEKEFLIEVISLIKIIDEKLIRNYNNLIEEYENKIKEYEGRINKIKNKYRELEKLYL
ncbi:hypothetical protein YN1_7530 [Nanoarchaeota archaeon]